MTTNRTSPNDNAVLIYKELVEEDWLPLDAQVLHHTWRYMNKNGGPDRRFNNNRQIPVVLYPQLTLSSPTGLNIVLDSSNLRNAAAFKDGIDKYRASRNKSEASPSQSFNRPSPVNLLQDLLGPT